MNSFGGKFEQKVAYKRVHNGLRRYYELGECLCGGKLLSTGTEKLIVLQKYYLMKKIILLYLLFPFFSSFAQQEVPEELKTRLDIYSKYNLELNFEKLMDYIYPELFTIAPREQLVQAFENAFNNEEMQIFLDSMRVVDFSKSFEHKGTKFIQVGYNMGMRLFFKDTSVLNEEFIELMTNTFKDVFQSKNVNYNEKTKAFEISGRDILFAILDEKYDNWYFLGYEENNKALLDKMIPAPVRMHFGLE